MLPIEGSQSKASWSPHNAALPLPFPPQSRPLGILSGLRAAKSNYPPLPPKNFCARPGLSELGIMADTCDHVFY